MADQESELDVLIRARYPLVYVVSFEERRVEAILERIATRRGKRLLVWTATRGFRDTHDVADPTTQTPRAALDHVAVSEQRALFVLEDFHPYLQDPAVVRRLRDLVQEIRSSYKSVLIVSPVLTIPVELEKDVTVLDLDLPGPDELRALLDDAVAASGEGRYAVDLGAGEQEQLIQAALGMTLTEAENAFARSIVLDSRISAQDLAVVLQEKKQIIRKARLLEYFEAEEEFGGIGGLETLKDWLRKRGRAFGEKARRFGLPEPKGLLLLGVQGCGKSLVCKAISSLWKLPLLRLDMGSIFGGYIGQSEENIRRAIKTAESIAPCVLWLDEIEKGLAGTQSSGSSDAGTTARVFSTFLTWLQEKKKPVFVAATANRISDLPPELLRKGRLDEIFFIDLPIAHERREILAIHIRKRNRDVAGFALDELAALTEGFSGAELEQAIVEALYEAFHQDRDVTHADVVAAIAATVPLSVTMAEEIDRSRAWAQTRARPASSPHQPPPIAAKPRARRAEAKAPALTPGTRPPGAAAAAKEPADPAETATDAAPAAPAVPFPAGEGATRDGR